jgi:hypothetical protein
VLEQKRQFSALDWTALLCSRYLELGLKHFYCPVGIRLSAPRSGHCTALHCTALHCTALHQGKGTV